MSGFNLLLFAKPPFPKGASKILERRGAFRPGLKSGAWHLLTMGPWAGAVTLLQVNCLVCNLVSAHPGKDGLRSAQLSASSQGAPQWRPLSHLASFPSSAE